jgi:hypothetical protein
MIHTINFHGLELEVIGNYEKPEDDTNYKGGWATEEVKYGGIEISWMLKLSVIEEISEQVISENY